MADGSVEVGVNDWVLMKGDEVIASNSDPNNLMDEYKKYDDGEVVITKNPSGQYLYY